MKQPNERRNNKCKYLRVWIYKKFNIEPRVFPKPKSPLSFGQICPKLLDKTQICPKVFKDLGGENFCYYENRTFWSI